MSLICLDLPEIVSLICAELQRFQAYGSLAAFVVTNNLICDIALDALWQWQDNLVYLLRTLPQHRIREIHPWDLRLVCLSIHFLLSLTPRYASIPQVDTLLFFESDIDTHTDMHNDR